MVVLPSSHSSAIYPSAAELLSDDEHIAVVDDSAEIVLLLSHYIAEQGFNVVTAGSAHELLVLLREKKIALVLLDIGLPDRDGNEILHEITESYPELGIIMVTGTTDIEVALGCLRQGADDYLTKPVSIRPFNHTIINTLKKRRLAINNRLFQEELQKTNAKMHFLHHLNLKMNTAYLNAVELQSVLRSILFGITSHEGLRFNRAFLALFDPLGRYLEGKLGIGPSCKKDAERVWNSIAKSGLSLTDILHLNSTDTIEHDIPTNTTIQALKISSQEYDHVLIQAAHSKSSIQVENATSQGYRIHADLIELLGVDSFVVVPLYSPAKSLGVIIVDNFVTDKQISPEDIIGLEIFASQASLAIEQSHLHASMEEKIIELEQVTEELEKNKDLLIDAERTAALGNMSAHLLHAIRNPITSIGGTSRLLSRKVTDSYSKNFLQVITEEANKIENVLEDISSFTENTPFLLSKHPLFPLLRRSVMIFYSAMKKNDISYRLKLDGPDPVLIIDEKKMRQLFLHLIRNSIEAMPSGGSLLIEAYVVENLVLIHFIATGETTRQGSISQIKDPFFSTENYGNGMGLALIEQILDAHHGDFKIESVTEGSAKITVRLPVNDGEKIEK